LRNWENRFLGGSRRPTSERTQPMPSSLQEQLSKVQLTMSFEKVYQMDPLRRSWYCTKPKLAQQNCDETAKTQSRRLWYPSRVALARLNSGATSDHATGDAGLEGLGESLGYAARNPP